MQVSRDLKALTCYNRVTRILKNMAGEEDNELRDLVAQALEAKGILGRIRVSRRSF